MRVTTDEDVLRQAHRFLRSEQDDADGSWEARLAAKYYARLFKVCGSCFRVSGPLLSQLTYLGVLHRRPEPLQAATAGPAVAHRVGGDFGARAVQLRRQGLPGG